MLATLRHVSAGDFPIVLVSAVTCLVLLFWRVTLLLLSVVLVTVFLYGCYALSAQPG